MLIGLGGIRPASLADMKRLERISPVNAATVEFTKQIDGTYLFYDILYRAIPVTDDAVPWLRVSEDGGSTFKSGATEYGWSSLFAGGTVGPHSAGTAAQLQLTGLSGVSTNDNEGFAGVVRIYDPADTTMQTNFTGESSAIIGAGSYFRRSFAGRYLSAAAVNAFQFLFSTGNIESGEFVLYGAR